MKVNSIKLKVIEVRTDSGICVGLAKTKKGEEYIMDGRTPQSSGICSNAFCALSNAAFIMVIYTFYFKFIFKEVLIWKRY